jgi:hypothetical protein
MVGFSAEVWLALGVLAAAGVLGMLHALATHVGNQKLSHDTRAKVASLRNRYVAQLAGEQDFPADVEIVEGHDDPKMLKEAA